MNRSNISHNHGGGLHERARREGGDPIMMSCGGVRRVDARGGSVQ
ncbi:hypothetical protein [Streptomyces sp. NPDC050564]